MDFIIYRTTNNEKKKGANGHNHNQLHILFLYGKKTNFLFMDKTDIYVYNIYIYTLPVKIIDKERKNKTFSANLHKTTPQTHTHLSNRFEQVTACHWNESANTEN